MLINFVSLILQVHKWHVLQQKMLYQNVLWNTIYFKKHRDAQNSFLNTLVILRAPNTCNCQYIWNTDMYKIKDMNLWLQVIKGNLSINLSLQSLDISYPVVPWHCFCLKYFSIAFSKSFYIAAFCAVSYDGIMLTRNSGVLKCLSISHKEIWNKYFSGWS